jgi:hypothetical protein
LRPPGGYRRVDGRKQRLAIDGLSEKAFRTKPKRARLGFRVIAAGNHDDGRASPALDKLGLNFESGCLRHVQIEYHAVGLGIALGIQKRGT